MGKKRSRNSKKNVVRSSLEEPVVVYGGHAAARRGTVHRFQG
jgi:hypothetical protein